MTNRDRYVETFAALHASNERLRKVYFMKNRSKKIYLGRIIAIAACIAALLTVSAFAANAATDGRLFEAIVFTVNGNVTNVERQEDGSYTFDTEDGIHGSIVAKDGAVLQTGEDGTVTESTYEVEVDSDKSVSMEVEYSDMELEAASGDTYAVRETEK